MRIRSTTTAAPSPVSAQDKTDLQEAIAATGQAAPTFEAVRAALAAGKRARFSDGMMHQTALELGLVVDNLEP